jgi:hypothetical protein
MKQTTNPPHGLAQRGMALVVALVLLLVMTMIAVVATRTTTVDLKMTTNTVLARRAFQSSEGSRMSIGQILESHVKEGGWPTTIGGSLSALKFFPIPDEISDIDPTAMYYLGTTLLSDLGPPTFSRDPDMRFRVDSGDDEVPQNTDMFGDIWVTRLTVQPAPGSPLTAAYRYAGPGTSEAVHVYFDVRARGLAPGNAQSITGANYRIFSP